MTVDVSSDSFQTSGVNRNMTQKNPVQPMVRADVLEERSVVIQWEDIVVTLDEYLLAVQSTQDESDLSIDENVPKMIDLIVGTDDLVPVLNHLFVTIVYRLELMTDSVSGLVQKLVHIDVTKMRVGNQKDIRHILCGVTVISEVL